MTDGGALVCLDLVGEVGLDTFEDLLFAMLDVDYGERLLAVGLDFADLATELHGVWKGDLEVSPAGLFAMELGQNFLRR